MIDCENLVFNPIAAALRNEFSGIFVTGEYVPSPASFPAVTIVDMDNVPDVNTQDSGSLENHAILMYQVDIYSNKTTGKKAECKAISAAVDRMFAGMGFTRTYLNPVQNMNDATIYRIVARYAAIVDNNFTIYRR